MLGSSLGGNVGCGVMPMVLLHHLQFRNFPSHFPSLSQKQEGVRGSVVLDGAASECEQVLRLCEGESVPQRSLSPPQSTHCSQLECGLHRRLCVPELDGWRLVLLEMGRILPERIGKVQV